MSQIRPTIYQENATELKEIAAVTAERVYKRYGIKPSEEDVVPSIAYYALMQLFEYVTETGEEINFMELFAVGVEEKETYLIPGPETKLLIKSDNDTEI